MAITFTGGGRQLPGHSEGWSRAQPGGGAARERGARPVVRAL